MVNLSSAFTLMFTIKVSPMCRLLSVRLMWLAQAVGSLPIGYRNTTGYYEAKFVDYVTGQQFYPHTMYCSHDKSLFRAKLLTFMLEEYLVVEKELFL